MGVYNFLKVSFPEMCRHGVKAVEYTDRCHVPGTVATVSVRSSPQPCLSVVFFLPLLLHSHSCPHRLDSCLASLTLYVSWIHLSVLSTEVIICSLFLLISIVWHENPEPVIYSLKFSLNIFLKLMGNHTLFIMVKVFPALKI